MVGLVVRVSFGGGLERWPCTVVHPSGSPRVLNKYYCCPLSDNSKESQNLQRPADAVDNTPRTWLLQPPPLGFSSEV